MNASAQLKSDTRDVRLPKDLAADTLDVRSQKHTFWKRFSFHTNLVEWAFTVPNAKIEFDLSKYRSNRYSVLAGFRFNPMVSHPNHRTKFVFNITGVHGEFRKYWRTGHHEESFGIENDGYSDEDMNVYPEPAPKIDSTLTGIKWPVRYTSYFRRKYLSGRYVKHPRYWRAYYLGAYASYDKFSFLLVGPGVQGKVASVGAVYGWSLPLFRHGNGSGWDIDLGVAAGVGVGTYAQYKFDEETQHHYLVGSWKSRRILPVLHDVHVSLVYRLRTIAEKVQYGAEIFRGNEVLRLKRIEQRDSAMNAKIYGKREVEFFGSYNELHAQASKMLENLNPASYEYIMLAHAVERTDSAHFNDGSLAFDTRYDEAKKKEMEERKKVFEAELTYYMKRACELNPDLKEAMKSPKEKAADAKLAKEKEKEEKKAAKAAAKSEAANPEDESAASESAASESAANEAKKPKKNSKPKKGAKKAEAATEAPVEEKGGEE